MSYHRVMVIELLTTRNAAEYRSLMLDAYARHSDAFTSTVAERATHPIAWWEARMSEDTAASALVLGAFVEGRLVGAAGLSFDTREKARHKSTLFGMYVPAEMRGRGVGQLLVQSVLDHAQARQGVCVVQLTVTQGNVSAQRLYERCGFVEFGVEPFAVAVGAQYVSKVHMWCDLGHRSK